MRVQHNACHIAFVIFIWAVDIEEFDACNVLEEAGFVEADIGEVL